MDQISIYLKRILCYIIQHIMSESPTIEKDTKKQLKKNALISFLQASTTSNVSPEVSKVQQKRTTPIQDQGFQQYVQELSNCNICGTDLQPEKRKKCQFCNMPACSEHLRKRRKKKGKWQRICDNCEDKYLYDLYMKLQSKADEALGIQQQITTLKHQNFLKQVEERREKRRQIGFKTMSIKERYQQQTKKIIDVQNRLMSFENQVQSIELSVNQLRTFVERVTTAFKENNQESWNILSQQNARMAKELTKLQKKAVEIKHSIEGKQKQIQTAFQAWQKIQFQKQLQSQKMAVSKKKDNCEVY